MAMLWRRKLNWSVGVKMISSLLTLILCLCWMGFALTGQTGDPRITYAQDLSLIHIFVQAASVAPRKRCVS